MGDSDPKKTSREERWLPNHTRPPVSVKIGGHGRVWSRWMPMPEMSFRKGDGAGEWS